MARMRDCTMSHWAPGTLSAPQSASRTGSQHGSRHTLCPVPMPWLRKVVSRGLPFYLTILYLARGPLPLRNHDFLSSSRSVDDKLPMPVRHPKTASQPLNGVPSAKGGVSAATFLFRCRDVSIGCGLSVTLRIGTALPEICIFSWSQKWGMAMRRQIPGSWSSFPFWEPRRWKAWRCSPPWQSHHVLLFNVTCST